VFKNSTRIKIHKKEANAAPPQRERSNIIWRFRGRSGGGLPKPSYRGGGNWPNRHITFTVAEKA